MDIKALSKAKTSLSIVERATNELDITKTFNDFSYHWFAFLRAAKGIYTILEQGSKSSAQSRQWFGRKDRERRDDQLLRYISEARNDDEHGIEEVAKLIPGALTIGVRGEGGSRAMADQYGNIFIDCDSAYRIENPTYSALPIMRSLDGMPILTTHELPFVQLATVQDRSKRHYHPPTHHLGIKISDTSPQGLAKLVLIHLRQLMAEAEKLHTQ